MTNKEDFKKLRDLFYSFFLDEDFDDVGVWNNIEKDLEILEILKGNANLFVNNINKEVKYIQISITTCDNRFNKVEGWLNEK